MFESHISNNSYMGMEITMASKLQIVPQYSWYILTLLLNIKVYILFATLILFEKRPKNWFKKPNTKTQKKATTRRKQNTIQYILIWTMSYDSISDFVQNYIPIFVWLSDK